MSVLTYQIFHRECDNHAAAWFLQLPAFKVTYTFAEFYPKEQGMMETVTSILPAYQAGISCN